MSEAPAAPQQHEKFAHAHYNVKRPLFNFFSFQITDPEGNLSFYVRQKAFKLKEDIRVFGDKDRTEELLLIKARSVIDFSAAYDVMDSITGEHIGVLRRKGWKSMFRDEWEMLDPEELHIGRIREDSGGLAFLRRFLTNLIPQSFHFETEEGDRLAEFNQAFNPFVYRMALDFSADPEQKHLDRRMAIATAVLLVAIEGRQQ